jgi:hypothetical protein
MMAILGGVVEKGLYVRHYFMGSRRLVALSGALVASTASLTRSMHTVAEIGEQQALAPANI